MTLSSTLSAQLWSFPQLHNMPHITSSRHQSLSSNLPLSCQGQIFGHLHRNAISRWLLHVLRPFLPIALFHRIYFWVILIGPCVSKIFRIRSYIYRRNVSPPDLRDRLSRITDLGFVEYPRRTPGYYITPPPPARMDDFETYSPQGARSSSYRSPSIELLNVSETKKSFPVEVDSNYCFPCVFA